MMRTFRCRIPVMPPRPTTLQESLDVPQGISPNSVDVCIATTTCDVENVEGETAHQLAMGYFVIGAWAAEVEKARRWDFEQMENVTTEVTKRVTLLLQRIGR